MKSISVSFLRTIAILATLFSCFHAFSAEAYIKLDAEIEKTCGITFDYPEQWKLFPVESNRPDEVCVIAYRLKGQREGSEDKFIVKKIPVKDRLGEFNFSMNKKGKVRYIGEDYTGTVAQVGYSKDISHSYRTIKQGEGVLYLGYGNFTWIDGRNKNAKVQDLDLLFGNGLISIGGRYTESDAAPSLRGNNLHFEKIYRSMRFVGKN